MITKLLAFISSTSELGEEREALRSTLRELGLEPYAYEHDRARRASPKEHCAQMIAQSDLFLGVLGTGYGSALDEAPESRSITEWEYDNARSHEGLQIMMFVEDATARGVNDPRQRRFIDRVRDFHGGSWCQWYRSSRDLVELATASIVRWLAEYYVRSSESPELEGQRRRQLRLALALSLGWLVVWMAVLGAHLLAHWFPTWFVLQATLLSVAVFAGALWYARGIL